MSVIVDITDSLRHLWDSFRVPPVRLAPRTHDYTRLHRYWSHDVVVTAVVDGGKRLRAMGWGTRIVAGDYILLTHSGSESDTRYRVEAISYYTDPSDQWQATLVFAPRPR